MMSKNKIVVAYSGGLDTSVMVCWLAEKYDAEIITVTGNIGQPDNFEELRAKAVQTGATKAVIRDLREEFVTEYVWKALKASARYEGIYPMATSIGRPLLAKLLVDVAEEEGANMIAHGCTGKGNDQVRFEVSTQILAPELTIVAPLRDWEFRSREEELDYALERGIPVKATKKSPYSIDDNLWGVSIECGVLEDPTVAPPEDAYQITVSPSDAPEKAEIVSIQFVKGIPVGLDGVRMGPVDLVTRLNAIGGRHGVGRLDVVENRVVGIKSREIYEAPAATLLHHAHTEIERLVLDRETFRFKLGISDKVANLIYDGLWFTPLFDACMAFVDSTQAHVEGSVTIELYKGNVRTLSKMSPYSLYREDLATYTSADTFDHKASEGFLRIYGLPYKTRSQVHRAPVIPKPELIG
jgi:argininosuccinate synthase